MIWGFAGVWPGEFGIYEGDRTLNILSFIVEHGFRSCGLSLRSVKDPERRDEVVSIVQTHDLRPSIHFGAKYFEDELADLLSAVDDFLAELQEFGPLVNASIVTTAVGPYHRFMEQPSLEEQMDRLAEVFTPLAAGCAELGVPFGIENHGDYYCSDLVALCERVPHLGMFLDTGNTYLIGEQSLPACRVAAPYTIGTHFKDHMVHPDPSELKFVVEGSALGEGHVGLRQVHSYLAELAADPDNLVMQWEMVPPKGMDPFVCLERSWQFVRSLEKEETQ